MSYNLLESLKEHLSGDVVSNLAALIGESPKNTESALTAALPSLLAAISEKSADNVSISGLFNLLTGGGHDGGVLSNLGALSRGGDETAKLMSEGGNLLLSIFGNKTAGLTELVAKNSGISSEAAANLLNFVTPIILGLLGRNLKISSIENANGLAGFLSGQSGLLANFLPTGFSSLLSSDPLHFAVNKTESESITQTVSETASKVAESISETFDNIGDTLKEATVNKVDGESIKNTITQSAKNVLDEFDKATELFDKDNISETANKLGDSISSTFENIGDTIEEAAEESIASVKEIAGDIGGSVGQMGSQVMTEGQQFAKSAAIAFEEGAGESRKFLPWILLAAALALVLGLLKSCADPTEPETTTEVTAPKPELATPPAQPSIAPPPAPATPEPVVTAPPVETAVEAAQSVYEKALSTGYSIKAANGGFISKLIGFIESNDPIQKDLWFSMDGITFDTNKATIKKESDAQLNDIAEILKAYPKVKIKIGGYTDNTGNAKSNKKLSANRATAVKKALAAKGIKSDRLDAEGYGSDHPVASNETEEGRQQNRRIDVRVTEK